MMTLQILSHDKILIEEIADFLLNENLIANAIITDNIVHKKLNENGTVVTQPSYSLKAMSKSLLFSTINERLRQRYGIKTPLIYSEPIILIDAKQMDELVARLVKV